jgi:putative hemolysin
MEVLIIFLLILLNGVFAMSEIATVSAKKSRLETAAKKGEKSALRALELANNPGRFLSTVQIGITLIGILTGIYSGEKIQDDLVGFLNNFEVLKPYGNTIAVVVIVVCLTFFSLVLGELVPKRIGLALPEKIAKVLAIPMHFISIITAPFIWLLTKTSDVIIQIIGVKASTEGKVTEEEIRAIIQEGTEGGAIDEIEQDIMERVFSMGDRKLGSLMTHRADVTNLELNMSSTEVSKVVSEELHSVYPVINEDSEVMGIVTIKDLFLNISSADFNLRKLIKTPEYVSESLSAFEALKFFKTGRKHHAVVVDEYGQMQGIVTMSDLLEALVGDVSDFHEKEFDFLQRADGSWLVDGQYPFVEFLGRFDMDEFYQEHDFNTLSGLILHELKRVPKAGDHFTWFGLDIEVLDMDGARIDKVLVTAVKG